MTARYDEWATNAINAGLPPATPDSVDRYWRSLGVTRQTAWNWRNGHQPIPLMARFAAAWLVHCAGSAPSTKGAGGT